MKRRSERPTPSSPTDRQSPLQRRNTKPISVDHEERTERRTAHIWGHTDNIGADPSPDRRQELEDLSFEDFRPADPISRLNSSAPPPQSARTSGATTTTVDDAAQSTSRTSRRNEFSTPHSTLGSASPTGELVDSAGNTSPDFNQQVQFGSQWQDWAAPLVSEAGQSDSHRHGSVVQSSYGQESVSRGSGGQCSQDDSAGKISTGEASMNSVESYHAALQKLNSVKTNDSKGTSSSVARWLKGQRRHKPDLRMAELERQQITRTPSELGSPTGMPRALKQISTFQPADQYKYLDTRSPTSQEREQRRAKNKRRVSIVLEAESPTTTRKDRKRSFFGSFGSGHKNNPKDLSKQPGIQRDNWERRLSTYSRSSSGEEPFGHASPLGFAPNKSSRRAGRTGYFSRQQRSSEGDVDAPVKGPYVGFSRRSDEVDSLKQEFCKLKQPQSSMPEQDGWLQPRRPRLTRYSSSPHSPGDTSARAMENPASRNAWKAHLDPKTASSFRFNDIPNRPPSRSSNNPPIEFRDAPLKFDGPVQKAKPVQPSPTASRLTRGYLTKGVNRVLTPSTPKEHREKEKYIWDSWYPYISARTSEKASTAGSDRGSTGSNQWHTPFPMPKESTISKTVAKDSETGDRDWYRVRIDQGSDDEVGPKDIEDLRMFQWDLPEHLPSSPLCPLSPKHHSKGKGVCVYHGRKRGGARKNAAPGDIGVELWK